MKIKIIQRLSLGAILAFASILRAQTPGNPDTSGQAAQAQEPTAEIPVATPTIAPIEPPSLIPPNNLPGPGTAALPPIPGAPELQLLNALFKQSSLGKAGDEHRLHVQMAELETQIRNDRELAELKSLALAARTDLERRHRLKAYYQRYFSKLRTRATAPELRAYLETQAATHELTLLQPRVRHEMDAPEFDRLALARANASPGPLPTPVQAKVNDVFQP